MAESSKYPLKNKRSEIRFKFTDVGNDKAKCGFCSTIISTVGGSTGNVSRYLRTKRPYSLQTN